MPESDEQATEGSSAGHPFADVWANYIQQMEAATSSESAESCRRQFLDRLSENLDAQMRTPAFLQAMKRNLDAMILAGQTLRADAPSERDNYKSVSNELRELLAQLFCIEERLATRLAGIEQRLEKIERNLADRGSPPDGN